MTAWVRWDLSTTEDFRPRPARLHGLFVKLSVCLLLVCVFVLTSCAGAAPPPVETQVLGVSVVTGPMGTTQIRSIGSEVNVQLLEASSVEHSRIALAQDGEIVIARDISSLEEVSLEVEEPGIYEVWALSVGEAVDGSGDVQLAPAQRIDRLGRVSLGD